MRLTEIKPNPNNPRLIKDDKFKKLVQSIKDFPAMMSLRPIVVNSEMIILGGNMRYKACKELKMKEIPDEWVKIADTLTEDEQKRFIIEDNVPFGEWDFDILANEWDADLLQEWGLNTSFNDDINIDDLGLKDNAFADAANALSFSITFNFPISEKEAFDNFDKKELEEVLRNFVYA